VRSEKQFNNSNATQDKALAKKKMGKKVKETTVLVPCDKLELGAQLDSVN